MYAWGSAHTRYYMEGAAEWESPGREWSMVSDHHRPGKHHTVKGSGCRSDASEKEIWPLYLMNSQRQCLFFLFFNDRQKVLTSVSILILMQWIYFNVSDE